MATAKNIEEGTDQEWTTVVAPFGETWAPENSGDNIIGIYKSVKQIEQEDMADSTKTRMVNVYSIVDTDGKDWSVWGSYAIDEAFKTIGEGQVVRIEYNGTVSIDGGKRTVKQFTVQTKN